MKLLSKLTRGTELALGYPGAQLDRSECSALVDAIVSLQQIARDDELVTANPDAFSIHAYKRCKDHAAWALGRIEAVRDAL